MNDRHQHFAAYFFALFFMVILAASPAFAATPQSANPNILFHQLDESGTPVDMNNPDPQHFVGQRPGNSTFLRLKMKMASNATTSGALYDLASSTIPLGFILYNASGCSLLHTDYFPTSWINDNQFHYFDWKPNSGPFIYTASSCSITPGTTYNFGITTKYSNIDLWAAADATGTPYFINSVEPIDLQFPPAATPYPSGVVWQSASSHDAEISVSDPLANPGAFNRTRFSFTIPLGMWNGPDFTTTASTTVRIWDRSAQTTSAIFDVGLAASSGGNPYVVTPDRVSNLIFGYPTYNQPASAGWIFTSAPPGSVLQEQILPTIGNVTIHHGDELWGFMYPSYASPYYNGGENVFVGGTGNVPQFQICEGECNAAPPTPAVCTPGIDPDCNSNVMFLPGIEGSRLYMPLEGGGELRVWEPLNDTVTQQLALDIHGNSVRSDIYTKTGDVLDADFGGNSYYASFISNMNALKSENVIRDWQAIAYDWRLSYEQLLTNGKQTGSHVSYLETSESPYIIKELERLAAASKTGKVTIVAHSNGGLLAKALMQKIGDAETARLIDKVILVASPQVGTPHAVGGLLYGYKQGFPDIPSVLPHLAYPATMRSLAENSPGANNLLPSAKYFDLVRDINHPVVFFDATHTYQAERTAYGNLVGNQTELIGFLLGSDGGRTKPAANDTGTANILNPEILSAAQSMHNTLDAWVPPVGVTMYQIAGWGNDTMSGVRFYEEPLYVSSPSGTIFTGTHIPRYEIITTEDGDDTVVVPSALATAASSVQVKNYWLNLKKYKSIAHANILESPEMNTLVQNILTNPTLPLPQFVSAEEPSSNDVSRKLRYFLHSPLTLEAYDASGHHVGINATTGQFDKEISGVTYEEFGETKMLTVPADLSFRLVMNGYASGFFSLDQQTLVSGEVATTTGFIQIPTSTTTVASMIIDPTAQNPAPLLVDKDGNGTTDFIVPAHEGASVTIDFAPPHTSASKNPTREWSASNVSVTLTADDGAFGSGVASTTYSFDNLHWLIYASTSPIVIQSEGTTKLWYRSSDKAGNMEQATSTIIRIDKTPPEARIGFSTSTKKILIAGDDTLSGVTIMSAATSTIVKDGADNTLKLKVAQSITQSNYATLVIPSFQYSTGSTTNATTSLRYFWTTDKNGKYPLFISVIKTPTERIASIYTLLTNKTYVIESTPSDDSNDLSLQSAILLLRKKLKTLDGLVIPSVKTKQAAVQIVY